MPADERPVEDLSDDALLTRADVTYVASDAATADWSAVLAGVDPRQLWGSTATTAWRRGCGGAA